MSFDHLGKLIPTAPQRVSPGAEEVFTFRWTDWLQGSNIGTRTFASSPQLTHVVEDSVGDDCILKLSGFQAGVTYTLSCTVTSSDAVTRKQTRSMYVQCSDE